MSKKRERIYEFSLLIFIIIIVFFTPNLIAWVKLNYFSSLLNIQKVSGIKLNAQSQISAFGFNGKIVCTTSNQLSIYNKEGTLEYQRQLFGNNTQVHRSGSNILIAELERGELALLDEKLDMIKTVKDIGNIENILTAGDAYVVVHIKNNNTIVILNSQLNEYGRFKVPLGDITSINMSQDKHAILVSVMAIDKNKLKSYVLQYDLKGNPVGTSDCEGELIYASYMTDNQIIITDSKIKSFSKESQLVAEILNMDKIDQSATHKNFLYVSYYESDDEGGYHPTMGIYSDDLSYNEKMKLVEMPEKIVVNDKFIVTNVEGTIYVFDHSLNSLGHIKTHQEIEMLTWLDQTHLMSYDKSHILVFAVK